MLWMIITGLIGLGLGICVGKFGVKAVVLSGYNFVKWVIGLFKKDGDQQE